MPRASTRSASSDERAWSVPASLRAELASRHGPVYSGAEADAQIARLGTFATCGDVVTADALRLGKMPLIGIIDRVTRRNDPIDPARFAPLAARGHRRVANPAGLLTERLRIAVREMVRSGGGLLEVDGEEDLAALALVEELPAGATVIYGIPGEGASFVRVDAATKEAVRTLLNRMPVRRISLGD